MISYANEEIKTNTCPGCAYGKHEFSLPCGMAYENERFTLSQDWELPIEGFLVVAPKRHVEELSKLTNEERDEMFGIVNKTIAILKKNNICNRFNIIIEEKENVHLHVWIMPQHSWMKKQSQKIMANIGTIFSYAKENFRDKETYDRINEITEIVREGFNI